MPTASSVNLKLSKPRRQQFTALRATISARKATWLHGHCKCALTSIAPTRRTGRSSIKTRSAGRRPIAGKSWGALFAILLGNRELELPQEATLRSRFKRWQRLVGSAVEYAAQCVAERNPDIDHVPDKMVDFATLFLDQEGEDEDSADWADCLDAITKVSLGSPSASEPCYQLNNVENDNTAIIKEVLFPAAPAGYRPTPKAVAKRLSAKVDDPVRHDGKILTLRSAKDTHKKSLVFWVEQAA
jgi:hypothetical protein